MCEMVIKIQVVHLDLIPKIPCDLLAKLGSLGHSWKNHFLLKIECKN
jgi:hypothetical protein